MSEWIKLNVGGQTFYTTRTTLMSEPESMLARMFSEENKNILMPCQMENDTYLIDRTPKYFEPLLHYLRSGRVILDANVNPEGVLEEAKYFGIDSMIPILEEIICDSEKEKDQDLPLTRREVVKILASTECHRELRFQGLNLAGADLSKLDLRCINFKYAKMKGCQLLGANLSKCNMERVDLSNAKLDGAQLLGVRMVCSNLEKASLLNCNFEDPAGSVALMEGCNLRGANLEGSQMAGVNLRVATLKDANMQNCDLRSAVLAGADLERCNLSGSDLNETNLRGANFKDTLLESMQSPLHMSQTIR